VQNILTLKQRPWQKGLILIAAELRQLQPYLDTSGLDMQRITAVWPGPVTWVMPASATVPSLLRGNHDSIAVRVTAHPLVKLLCLACHGPLVSTSANRSGREPARSAAEIRRQFDTGIDYLLDGRLGDLAQPTPIFDARNGRQLRA
jgi:L-threonylcarbamoyladenylate synthase